MTWHVDDVDGTGARVLRRKRIRILVAYRIERMWTRGVRRERGSRKDLIGTGSFLGAQSQPYAWVTFYRGAIVSVQITARGQFDPDGCDSKSEGRQSLMMMFMTSDAQF